ncbi:MAG: DNA mismatch repair endonuclease MutL [Gemmatimonadetes bacterium]|nr:DNA mismatch repair endonuclease MutL [Gemmatimonadota bacterium]MYD12038.1 DNA mismatch repair endonuclease MutL [Gemmatimonadota bacterium]
MSAPCRPATPRIRVLPDHVANQIAAGEVVERPSSVVKELVENALDAGAGAVTVSIERGGKGRIRVADDGAGMVREDLLACLDRHATSKIRHAEDLSDIRTLGFRGEALPSIAAVSHLVIETAAGGEETGSRLRSHGGRIQVVEEMARRRGTTVDVRNLFLNVPVRARFLSSVAVEARAVSEVIHGLALANLGVRFVFEADGRTVLDLPAAGGPLDRITAIWRDAGEKGLLPLSARRDGLEIEGVVQRPDLARAKGFRRVHLMVNGRPIVDPGVVAAGDRGYRTTVPEGTRPWLFLFLSVPATEVDVNVHPGKAEVRFRHRLRIENFVEASVRQALEGIESAATWDRPQAPSAVREGPGTPGGDGGARGIGTEDPRISAADEAARSQDDPDIPQMYLFRRPDDAGGAEPEPEFLLPRPALLQMHNSFIVAETRDGIVIVDQHAAHERVLYERIVESLERGADLGQRLLFPFTVRLTRTEVEAVEAVRESLAQVGFAIESFGSDTLLVQSVPSPHPHFDAQRCIREMIADIAGGSDLMRSARNQREAIAMTFACKAAIKAGQKLSQEEMQELFDQLFATSLPYHDIHGRPTVVSMGLNELRHKFGRT